jgi:hypothetical protein
MFRGTSDCRGSGDRIEDKDKTCRSIIMTTASGYCECEVRVWVCAKRGVCLMSLLVLQCTSVIALNAGGHGSEPGGLRS